jgi:flagellar biosynthesis chaperone FliJ
VDAESGSRALSAANDLVELLRLAQSAAERVAQEVFGASYEHAELIERELQRLRRSADKLAQNVEGFVSREEGTAVERGHPLRRASDH